MGPTGEGGSACDSCGRAFNWISIFCFLSLGIQPPCDTRGYPEAAVLGEDRATWGMANEGQGTSHVN